MFPPLNWALFYCLLLVVTKLNTKRKTK